MKVNGTLLRSTLVAALGGLLFGFDTAVISGTTESLEQVFQLSSFWLGFTVATALIGTIIGSVIFSKPADTVGRKITLLILGALYLVSALGSAFAWDWYSFIIFRFVGGLGVGGASVISPMYIAEISPAPIRGRLVAINQFNIVVGILLAFFSNYIISGIPALAEVDWRWMLGVEALPAAVFFVMVLRIPRSPRWLVTRDRVEEARAVLESVGSEHVEEEMQEIIQSIRKDREISSARLFTSRLSKPVLFTILIAMFNQLSGINALMYYAPKIFMMAGAAQGDAMLQSVVIGGTNLVFTILAMMVIDNFGRRKLMLVGSIGYIISLVTVAVSFYIYGTDFSSAGGMVVLGGLVLFIASHAFGQGAVIWVFISEMFPNRVRAKGQSLGSFTHWFMAAAVSWTFPVLADISGGHAFAIFAFMMVLQLLFVIFMMPETKGVPLEEMQEKLGLR